MKTSEEIIQEAKLIVEQGQKEIDKRQVIKEISSVLLNELKPVLDNIAVQLNNSVQQYLEGIKNIKIEVPQVTVNTPDVKVPEANVKVEIPKIELPAINIPDINIPEIKIPEIKIDTLKFEQAIAKAFKGLKFPSAQVTVQEREFPKEVGVKGIGGYFKSLLEAFKGLLRVQIEGVDVQNPLAVRLVDKRGKFYEVSMDGLIGGRSGGGGVSLASSPTTYNVDMAGANTEYSKLLPNGTKKIYIKLRSLNALLKVSFIKGESGITYVTIPFGATFSLDDVDLNNVTIYFQSPTAAQSAEIICFT